MSLALTSRKAALLAPWLRNPLWAAARAVPSLDLRFADSKSLVDATTGANLVTFTRASEATFVNSQGQIQTAAINAPRFDHNPTTGESLGLLVEESRQNLLLNSGTLSTQNVTVTAVAHTLSFTGTGTITLSGTSTAGPLVGTGTGEANRVSLTFTPTAGTLTLTVSGTVTNAQLEIGAFRTSYIPTAGTAVTRSADVASISGSNFSSWYRQDYGSFFSHTTVDNLSSFARIFQLTDSAASTTRIALRRGSSSDFAVVESFILNAGQGDLALNAGSMLGTDRNAVAIEPTSTRVGSANGAAVVSNTNGSLPTGLNTMSIGSAFNGTASLNGTIRRLTYWPQRLGNEVLQRITQ